MPQLLDLPKGSPDQLVAIAGNFHDDDRKELVQGGVAVFDDPTVATLAIAKLVRAGRAFAKAKSIPVAASERAADARGCLGPMSAFRIADEVPVASVEDALEALREHGRIALKLSAPSLQHRTELAGVATGLSDEAAVRRAFAFLSSRVAEHEAAHPGLSIIAQEMLNGVEMLIGVRQDPNFGPLVFAGSGERTMCELHGDLSYRKTPIERQDAEAIIEGARAARMLGGWRGTPAAGPHGAGGRCAAPFRCRAGIAFAGNKSLDS